MTKERCEEEVTLLRQRVAELEAGQETYFLEQVANANNKKDAERYREENDVLLEQVSKLDLLLRRIRLTLCFPQAVEKGEIASLVEDIDEAID